MPRKRILQKRRVHDYLNAQTGSLRGELATATRTAQEISGRLQTSQKLFSLEILRIKNSACVSPGAFGSQNQMCCFEPVG
jgi:hypothetical protein